MQDHSGFSAGFSSLLSAPWSCSAMPGWSAGPLLTVRRISSLRKHSLFPVDYSPLPTSSSAQCTSWAGLAFPVVYVPVCIPLSSPTQTQTIFFFFLLLLYLSNLPFRSWQTEERKTTHASVVCSHFWGMWVNMRLDSVCSTSKYVLPYSPKAIFFQSFKSFFLI